MQDLEIPQRCSGIGLKRPHFSPRSGGQGDAGGKRVSRDPGSDPAARPGTPAHGVDRPCSLQGRGFPNQPTNYGEASLPRRSHLLEAAPCSLLPKTQTRPAAGGGQGTPAPKQPVKGVRAALGGGARALVSHQPLCGWGGSEERLELCKQNLCLTPQRFDGREKSLQDPSGSHLHRPPRHPHLRRCPPGFAALWAPWQKASKPGSTWVWRQRGLAKGCGGAPLGVMHPRFIGELDGSPL